MHDDVVDFPTLMHATLAGNRVAYSQLLVETSRFLRPFLARALRSESDREDVLQEILISIHKAKHTYDGNRPYKPWAFAIAKFRLSDFLRKTYKDRLRHSVDLEEAENISDADVTKSGFTYESIHKVVNQLPEKQAMILKLLHKEGLTLKEVAHRIGMKELAVKVAAHRAYKILRKKIGGRMTNTDDLIESLSADMALVKPASSPLIAGCYWVAGLTVYMGVMIAFFGLRDDILTKLPVSLFAAELGLLTLLMITSAMSALLLSYPDLYQKPWLALSPIPVLALFVLVLFLEWLRDVPPAAMPAHGAECLQCISELSLVPAGFLLYRMRKFASVHYYLAGAIALLSAFSLGAFILRLAEKTDSIAHVIEWHYFPMIGTALIGLLLGRLVLKW